MGAQITDGVTTVAATYVKGGVSGSGTNSSLMQRVMKWWAAGVNGTFALLLGQNDSQFSFTFVQYDTLGNVQTWKGNVEAFRGKKVTITDDQGTAWGNLVVEEVRAAPKWRTPAINGPATVTTRGELVVVGFVVN